MVSGLYNVQGMRNITQVIEAVAEDLPNALVNDLDAIRTALEATIAAQVDDGQMTVGQAAFCNVDRAVRRVQKLLRAKPDEPAVVRPGTPPIDITTWRIVRIFLGVDMSNAKAMTPGAVKLRAARLRQVLELHEIMTGAAKGDIAAACAERGCNI